MSKSFPRSASCFCLSVGSPKTWRMMLQCSKVLVFIRRFPCLLHGILLQASQPRSRLIWPSDPSFSSRDASDPEASCCERIVAVWVLYLLFSTSFLLKFGACVFNYGLVVIVFDCMVFRCCSGAGCNTSCQRFPGRYSGKAYQCILVNCSFLILFKCSWGAFTLDWNAWSLQSLCRRSA